MPTDLRAVKSFPQLLRYLRDELLWPIETEDAEELTFEYAPEDFTALAPEHHVQIERILQLRPLVSGQPWGIFYVQFKKARLPVVVLRELLASLVFKKRASANKSERPAWECHDLLFISSYGEDTDHRHLNFAHFSDQPNGAILPALRVLDWDGDDTDRALNRLDGTLHEKLRWPSDDTNLDVWREQWSAAFRRGLHHPIRKAEQLALALASLAQNIRASVLAQMAVESEKGKLRTLHAAFRSALIQDLETNQFADMFAQTIAYGLFTNATRRTAPGAGTALTADGAVDSVTSLSPFLRELLGEFLSVGGRRRGGLDYDKLGVNEVVDLLTAPETDLQAVLDDFGHKKRDEDPVIHFYETFLAAYDKAEKVRRGVFYTPQPVVSYIVRSVHELLQTEFGLPHGLASTETWGAILQKLPGLTLPNLSDDPAKPRPLPESEFFVQVLDPATGTATFLVETISVIYAHLKQAWDKEGGLAAMPEIHAKPAGSKPPKTFVEYWNIYVPTSLLPRLYGYELMMAPYAIAHMKIALKLADTGFTAWGKLGPDDRVHIYLTNALEPKRTQLPQVGFEALAHEADAVNTVKWEKRFTVVIGNPPYSNYGQLNRNPFILGLLEDYKRGLDEKKINLDDDFIKFVRFAQWCVNNSQLGVLGFITNNIYLEGATHRQMRRCLAEAFGSLRVVDLHGDGRKQQKGPGGLQDENVFDIIQGVAVALFTKHPALESVKKQIATTELLGARSDPLAGKYEWLGGHSIGTTDWTRVDLRSPNYFFVLKDLTFEAEYMSAPPIDGVFSIMWSGIQTKRDSLTIDWCAEDAWEKVSRASKMKPDDLIREFELPDDGRDWKANLAIEDLRTSGPEKENIIEYSYRPLDNRYIYYSGRTKGWIAYPRNEASSHLLNTKNVALIVKRSRMINVDHFCHIFVVNTPPDINYLADQTYFMPLYSVHEHEASLFRSPKSHHENEGRAPNVTQRVVLQLGDSLGIRFIVDGSGDLSTTFGPEDVFHYAYAVLHSPTYRSRYAEFLKNDFPRLPLPGSIALFRALAKRGGELVALHLLDSPLFEKLRTMFIGPTTAVIERIAYEGGTVFIDKAKTSGFAGIPEAVFNFHIGGYQVCEKWLKDRKGRNLSADDRTHYQKIIVALSETIRLMAEIDEGITKHGGFPGAFAAAPVATPDQVSAPAPKPQQPDLSIQTEDELPLG